MGWFMKTAMDGIVSGVIGGIVTGGAVMLTLRHERQLRKDERGDAALAELRDHVVATLAMMSRAWILELPGDEERILEFIPQLFLQGLLGQARAASVAPRLAAVFEQFNVRIGDALPRNAAELQRFAQVRQVLEVQMHAWMRDPDGYETSAPEVVWPIRLEDGVDSSSEVEATA